MNWMAFKTFAFLTLVAVAHAEHEATPRRPIELRFTREPIHNPDVFRTSIKFDLAFNNPTGLDMNHMGSATLVGLKKNTNQTCRFVFATSAHTFVVPKNHLTLKKISFATGKYLNDVKQMMILPHPTYSFPVPVEDAQWDAALILVVAACPEWERIQPFPVAYQPSAKDGFLFSTRFFRNRPEDKGSPETGLFTKDLNFDVELTSEETFPGQFAFANKQNEIFPEESLIYYGHSGAGIFHYENEECLWIGCLRARSKESNRRVLAVGRNPQLIKWIKENTTKLLSAEELKTYAIEEGKVVDSGISVREDHKWPEQYGID